MPPPPDGSNFGSRRKTFYELITEAVADVEANGFDQQSRIDGWVEVLRRAALESMTPLPEATAAINAALSAIYTRMVERGGVLKMHTGVSRFTLDRVKPQLRAELDRRIMASANLIRLDRAAAVEKTMQRFVGWSTSIPAGGSDAVDRNEVKAGVRKALAQLPYAERRVAIDQGHKLAAAVSDVVAVAGGAIAAVWRSHFRQPGYHYRLDHKERDGRVYVVRGNWAAESGLMKRGSAGYTDEITQPAEEVFCRCNWRWLYALRDLPDEMVTVAGRAELTRVKTAA